MVVYAHISYITLMSEEMPIFKTVEDAEARMLSPQEVEAAATMVSQMESTPEQEASTAETHAETITQIEVAESSLQQAVTTNEALVSSVERKLAVPASGDPVLDLRQRNNMEQIKNAYDKATQRINNWSLGIASAAGILGIGGGIAAGEMAGAGAFGGEGGALSSVGQFIENAMNTGPIMWNDVAQKIVESGLIIAAGTAVCWAVAHGINVLSKRMKEDQVHETGESLAA